MSEFTTPESNVKKLLRNEGIEKKSYLTARSEPCRQPGRQFRREDAILRGFQIVRRAVEVNDSRLRIEQRKRRAPVSIARLADRARIDHVARIRFQLQ